MFDRNNIPAYTEIVYKYGNDNPLYLEEKSEFRDKRIVLKGEGGNRHIDIALPGGWIDLYVDTHVYDGKYFAFIGSITTTGKPSAWDVIEIMRLLSKYADKYDYSYWFTKDQINGLFKAVCDRY